MPKQAPLRRVKTHTAETGFVYQYYFVGSRPAMTGAATEYIFDVTADRARSVHAVSIFLEDEALEAWSAVHGRELTDTERYAAAKLRLLRGFDETEDLFGSPRRFIIDADIIEELLAPLGLE